MFQASSIVAAFLLVAPLGIGSAPLSDPVRLVILTDVPLDLPAIAGDPRVGFVVVEARDPVAVRALYRERVVEGAPAWADAIPDDALWSVQWGPQALDLPSAWDVEAGSVAVKVAVIDSGLDASHPEFAGVPIENGTDLVQGDATPQDENGHGTHVAGILAATRDNVAGVAGVARVTLVPIRVLGANGQGTCLDIALAVLEAVARGASIINLSLECGADYVPLHLAIQSATQAGALVVAAAGNGNGASAGCAYPAAYPEVVSVAALDAATSVAPYSCRGPAVELAAPGSGILSTWLGGGYRELSGTSMAVPHVSGVAALVKAHAPTLNGAAIRARLDATAVDLGDAGRDDASGFGRVAPLAALTG